MTSTVRYEYDTGLCIPERKKKMHGELAASAVVPRLNSGVRYSQSRLA